MNEAFLATLEWGDLTNNLHAEEMSALWGMFMYTMKVEHSNSQTGEMDWVNHLILAARANADDNP